MVLTGVRANTDVVIGRIFLPVCTQLIVLCGGCSSIASKVEDLDLARPFDTPCNCIIESFLRSRRQKLLHNFCFSLCEIKVTIVDRISKHLFGGWRLHVFLRASDNTLLRVDNEPGVITELLEETVVETVCSLLNSSLLVIDVPPASILDELGLFIKDVSDE